MEIEYISEFIFRDTTFFKESMEYLQTLENTNYFKVVYLIDEGFSLEYIINKIGITYIEINNLYFILQSYWGLKFEDKVLLRKRNMNCLKDIKENLPQQFYWSY